MHRRAAKNLEKKRRMAREATETVIREWLVSEGTLTEDEAVRMAILGVPVWLFFARIFVAEVARWAFRRIWRLATAEARH